MFEAKVAQFYRSKGYQVHQNPKVRGTSENIYTVAMVADGPLGALLISFGDAGGIDAPEIGRVRTMARDIGATPVVAAPTLTPDLRRLAAQMAVVVVDEATVTDAGPLPRDLPGVAADPMRRDLDAHPWPASGRAFIFAGPTAASARDVDELVADLHRPQPPRPAPPSLLVAPVAPVPAAAPPEVDGPVAQLVSAGGQTLVQPAVQSFSWLQAGLAPNAPSNDLMDLSALLGSKRPAPQPALEHEASLQSRTSRLERAQQTAGGFMDRMRDLPWRTISLAGAGAGFLILFIRWFA